MASLKGSLESGGGFPQPNGDVSPRGVASLHFLTCNPVIQHTAWRCLMRQCYYLLGSYKSNAKEEILGGSISGRRRIV